MKKILYIMLIVSVAVVTSCQTSAASNTTATAALAPVPAEYVGQTNPLGEDAVVAGADVFKTNCSACHGAQGHGDGPAGAALNPPPKNLAELQAKAGDDYLFWRINTGKDGTSMIAWKGVLTDEQIWQVIAFLHTLK